MITDHEIPAMLRLLQDRSDAETREAVLGQLRKLDTEALAKVRAHAVHASDQVLMEVESVLHGRQWTEMAERLPALVRNDGEGLLGGLIFLAKFGHAECRQEAIEAAIDEVVAACSEAVKDCSDVVERADAIARAMGRELGFAGNEGDYYSPENSFIDSVLQTRRGIPITLSALYVVVGERLGVPLRGVGLPGHFVVGLYARDEKAVFYDPFRRGVRLSKLECSQIVRQAGFDFEERSMAPVGVRYILQRMLNNLLLIYTRQGDVDRRLAVERFSTAIA